MSYIGNDVPAGLVFFEGKEHPRQYVVFRDSVVKGQCKSEVFTPSSLQLEYPFLDPEQCRIYYYKGEWIYKNLSENTFTFVGGQNLTCGMETVLQDGMVIRIANERMLTAVFLKEFVGGCDWKVIHMDNGRHQVQIVDQNHPGEIAMQLVYEDKQWILQEMADKNVLLNGQDVDEVSKIRIDDCIQVRDTRFFFEGTGLLYGYPVRQNNLSIQIDERAIHKARSKITLLKDINLSIEPNNMVLILGGSGAGKSTFVNAVTGYEKARATIKGGEIDFYKDYDQIRHHIGFVPQDNLLREQDTVYDTVRNAAEMRLPDFMSDEEKDRRTVAVLETFGLTGREKERISKLSGGQKKRLSICTEFIASPSLFILDEPDSGLDGIMAEELMENLRLIACQGRIVLVITHSPDRVAHLFDKVIVLAKGTEEQVGQLAFYGSIQEAKAFFGTDSMEGIVQKINAVNEGGEGKADEYIEKYKATVEEQGHEGQAEQIYADAEDTTFSEEQELFSGDDSKKNRYKSRNGQIGVYTGKHFRLFVNEKGWKVFILAAIIAGLVMFVIGGRMFRTMEYTKYGALALICVCIWNGMFNSIQVVCRERSIIKREHRTGLHISAYLGSHMIYQAFLCFVQVIITMLIFWLFGMHFPDTGLITGSFVLDVGISMFLATYAADMLGLMVSCIVHTTNTAMTLLPILLVIQLIFAGSLFPLNGAFSSMLAKLTISSWGINAVNIAADYNDQKSEVLGATIDTMTEGLENTQYAPVKEVLDDPLVREELSEYSSSKMQIADYEYTVPNMWKCWGVLIIFSAVYVLIGLAFLEFIDRDKR